MNADEFFAMRVVARPEKKRSFLGRWLYALFLVASADAGDHDNSAVTVPGYLLVERVDTGAEVLRLDSDMQDGHTVEHVREHLETLSVAEFCERWGIVLDDSVAEDDDGLEDRRVGVTHPEGGLGLGER